MIFFSGWKTLVVGAVAAVIWFGIASTASTVFSIGVGAIIAGAFVGAAGYWVNRAQPGIDPSTQERITYRERNSIMWIPLQFWSIPLVLVGILALSL